VAVGDGRGDGVSRVYGANCDKHIYEFPWTGSSWERMDLGSGGGYGMFGVAVGDGRGDGVSRVYGANGNIYEFSWNNPPTLTWTGEIGYNLDGLNKETGNPLTRFVYRVKYEDTDNDAPKSDYPKVHIKKGGEEISGSPFTMAEVDPGDKTYSDGKLYTYSTKLSPGTDYTYYFEAYDSWDAKAIGDPTSEIDAPDVSLETQSGKVKIQGGGRRLCKSRKKITDWIIQ
ncbi:MAG: hypothetical protein QME40_07700, partial [bacterium]|nr:hypothetical protein [bacterium]